MFQRCVETTSELWLWPRILVANEALVGNPRGLNMFHTPCGHCVTVTLLAGGNLVNCVSRDNWVYP